MLWFLPGLNAPAQVVYFLVGELPGRPPISYESYVLPLSRADHLAHARDLIARGPRAGRTIVVADIGSNDTGINRNYLDCRYPAWPWEVKEFLAFADYTAEILDGRPSMLPPGNRIGFWGYTVVRELGPAPLYLSLVPGAQGLHLYWSGLGANYVYSVESSRFVSATNWTPIPGGAWPLKTNHWLVSPASGDLYFRVKADRE